MVRSKKEIARGEVQKYTGLGAFADRIMQVPIGDLIPYANNARTHDDKQLELIGRSIQSVGFLNPVLATRDGVIVAGHGRVAAAKRLGLTDVPVLRIEGLTEDQIRAYRLADNRLAQLAGWDDAMIKIEMQHLTLSDLDFTIEMTGWSLPEIDIMLTSKEAIIADADASDEADASPDIGGPAVSKPGDIWLLGAHRLACGSALDPALMARLMSGAKARQLLQDPPWNIPTSGFISTTDRHREFVMAAGEMTDPDFQTFLDTNLDVVLPHLVDGAIIQNFIDWRSVDKVIASGKSRGLEHINICVWNKSNGSLGSIWRSKHELCVVFKKPGDKHVNNVQLGRFGRYRTNVWDFAGCNSFGAHRDTTLAIHPTAKSVNMIAEAMRDVSHRGDIVLDCFMGSGTALIAAERTGRIAYGMDLDPLYVDAAIRRWMDLTGEDVFLEGTELSFEQIANERGAAVDPSAAEGAGPAEDDEPPVIDARPTPNIRRRTRPSIDA